MRRIVPQEWQRLPEKGGNDRWNANHQIGADRRRLPDKGVNDHYYPAGAQQVSRRRSRFGLRQTCCRFVEEVRFSRLRYRPKSA